MSHSSTLRDSGAPQINNPYTPHDTHLRPATVATERNATLRLFFLGLNADFQRLPLLSATSDTTDASGFPWICALVSKNRDAPVWLPGWTPQVGAHR